MLGPPNGWTIIMWQTCTSSFRASRACVEQERYGHRKSGEEERANGVILPQHSRAIRQMNPLLPVMNFLRAFGLAPITTMVAAMRPVQIPASGREPSKALWLDAFFRV